MSTELAVRCKMLDFMGRHAMTAPGDGVLCALSGGADSIAMTQLLWESREQLGIRLAAAHFIHGLRPEDAPEELELVRQFCRQRQIPLTVGQGDTRAYCQQNRCGIEEGARQLRYEFLRQSASQLQYSWIATAHHLDDNGETVLLNLCRGTGLRGLGGIPPKRDGLIRPLLTVSRRQIEQYLAEKRIPYRNDPSNESEQFARNRLRRQVLPQLRQVNSRALEHLGQAACRARQDEQYLEQLASDFVRQNSRPGRIPAAALAQAPPSLSLRAVQLLYRQNGGVAVLSDSHRQAVLDLCQKGPSAQLALPGDIAVRRQYEWLVFGPENDKNAEKALAFPPQLLQPGKPVCQNGWQVTLYRGEAPPGQQGQLVAFDRLMPPVVLRSRQQGDCICQGGHRKNLKKWMIEQKIPAGLRDGLPLVCDQLGPVLVCGGIARDRQSRGKPAWVLAVRRIT